MNGVSPLSVINVSVYVNSLWSQVDQLKAIRSHGRASRDREDEPVGDDLRRVLFLQPSADVEGCTASSGEDISTCPLESWWLENQCCGTQRHTAFYLYTNIVHPLAYTIHLKYEDVALHKMRLHRVSSSSSLLCVSWSVSHLYGFGLVDAEAMVLEATKWRTVPSQHTCSQMSERRTRWGQVQGGAACQVKKKTVVGHRNRGGRYFSFTNWTSQVHNLCAYTLMTVVHVDVCKWSTILLQLRCNVNGTSANTDLYCRYIPAGQSVNSSITTSGCSEEPEEHVHFLEHVVVKVLIAHPRRGDLEINLISPSWTRTQLLAKRWELNCMMMHSLCLTVYEGHIGLL